jgi:hypothetical protein
MNQTDTGEMTGIIHHRIFKGGGIAGLWSVFRKNQLAGIFIIVGTGSRCTLELDKGKVVRFSLTDDQGNWVADQALTRLMRLVKKSNVRFSLFVNP